MQAIQYNVKRSSFYGAIESAIHEPDGLSRPVQFDLDKTGGYPRDVQIVIGDDPHVFLSSWQGAERRFSARLRAAATVLRDHRIHGRFHAVHRDGRVTLERA